MYTLYWMSMCIALNRCAPLAGTLGTPVKCTGTSESPPHDKINDENNECV